MNRMSVAAIFNGMAMPAAITEALQAGLMVQSVTRVDGLDGSMMVKLLDVIFSDDELRQEYNE